jgi:SUMO ligase MMS21 Smc5/6 complex component|tara:strand:+ start:1493 stop:1849 length:357 start_codon:yes stop_codon:yes gene_type:complete
MEENEETCPICLELMVKDIVKIKCNHVFHKSCLEQWDKNCPMCRHEYIEIFAWYSQKQFENIIEYKNLPYIYYDIMDINNNEKIVQITEIGKQNLYEDAICLGKVIKFNCVSKEHKIF